MSKQQLTDHEVKHLISETEREIERLENYLHHLQQLFQRARDSVEAPAPRKPAKKKATRKV